MVSSIVAAGLYKDIPQFVGIASLLALLGFFGERAIAYSLRVSRIELDRLEDAERMFLQEIRKAAAKGEGISAEILSRSAQATVNARDAYKKIYGHDRPGVYIMAKNETEKNAGELSK